MQNRSLPLISISRENYVVPKGEEHLVHYKAERVLFANNGMTRLSHPDLIKTGVKMFDEVKRNLELQGFTIEIVYHPNGKYTNVRIPKDASMEIEERDKEIKALKEKLVAKDNSKAIEEKNAEIEALKAEIAMLKSKETKETEVKNDEANEESEVKEEGETTSPKKGRPSKKNA